MGYALPNEIIEETLAKVDAAKEAVQGKAVIVSVVMTGYFITLAVKFSRAFLYQALECLEQAKHDVNEYKEDSDCVQDVDLGRFRVVIYETLAQMERLEEMHRKAGKWYHIRLGFDKITRDLYALFGVISR